MLPYWLVMEIENLLGWEHTLQINNQLIKHNIVTKICSTKVTNGLKILAKYLCHVCMNKTRKKSISVQGFPTVSSLFFRPTLAHFIGIFCKTPLNHHILDKHC
jgi:hypothetical protein